MFEQKNFLKLASAFLLLAVIFFGQNFFTDKFNLKSVFLTPAETNLTLPSDGSLILEEINPPAGFEIKAKYGDLGIKLIESGAIDFEKFKKVYENSSRPLDNQYLDIFQKNSEQNIKITQENAHFLLNFLWAFGLNNKNQILEEGPLMQYGKDEIGNFASTGGWTLGKKDATELYSKYEIIRLTPAQQKIVEEVAYNTYRPCCDNSTAFADCNHGMAALGLIEIMASNDAAAQEIFEALKYFNGFWFPAQYLDLAVYFKIKENKNFVQIPGEIILGKDFSTASGWSKIHQWLKANNLAPILPSQGGSCGV